jgi:hypothetical protein
MTSLAEELVGITSKYRRKEISLTFFLYDVERLFLGSYGEEVFRLIAQPFAHLSEIDGVTASRGYKLSATEIEEVQRLLDQMLNAAQGHDGVANPT